MQVTACLTAPSHHPNHVFFLLMGVCGTQPGSISQRMPRLLICIMNFKIILRTGASQLMSAVHVSNVKKQGLWLLQYMTCISLTACLSVVRLDIIPITYVICPLTAFRTSIHLEFEFETIFVQKHYIAISDVDKSKAHLWLFILKYTIHYHAHC